MANDINIFFAAGIIRRSSSLLGVGFFLVSKNDGSLCPRIDDRKRTLDKL